MRPGTTLILQQSFNSDGETDKLRCKIIEYIQLQFNLQKWKWRAGKKLLDFAFKNRGKKDARN